MAHNKTLTIGIIGAGANTRSMHIPLLQEIENVVVQKVCNRTVESGKRVAEEFSIPHVCSSWREIIEDDQIDAIVIGTWPNMHCVLTCEALTAGKHVLCEARMAMNAGEAHEMLAMSMSEPDLVTQIVPAPFTLPFDKTVCDFIAEDLLGDILVVSVKDIGVNFIDRESPITWRQDIDKSGLNSLMMGIWYETVARWIGHASAVTAMSKIFVKQRNHITSNTNKSIHVPDHVDVIADMACGAQAHFQFSAVTGLPGFSSGIWLFGSEGTLHLDGNLKKLFFGKRGDSKLVEVKIAEKDKGQWRVEEEFINAIRGREEVQLTTFNKGVKYMEFTEAVSLSAATGNRVNLPLVRN